MAAKAVLQSSKWFSQASPAFQDDLAKLMSPIDAAEGHVFAREGRAFDAAVVVERGLLIRTKAPAAGGEPVLLDKIGPGGTSGFLHVVTGAPADEVAFATVAAAHDSAGRGPLRAWVVDGAAFRALCAGDAGHAAEVVKVRRRRLLPRAIVRDALPRPTASCEPLRRAPLPPLPPDPRARAPLGHEDRPRGRVPPRRRRRRRRRRRGRRWRADQGALLRHGRVGQGERREGGAAEERVTSSKQGEVKALFVCVDPIIRVIERGPEPAHGALPIAVAHS